MISVPIYMLILCGGCASCAFFVGRMNMRLGKFGFATAQLFLGGVLAGTGITGALFLALAMSL